MKRHITRYALFGALILVGFNLLTILVLGLPDEDSFGTGEVVGYAAIVVSLLTVVVGMRSYREEIGRDAFSFGRGVAVGLGIALGPALAFGLYNLVYVTWIDPAFGDKYTAYLLEQARQTMTDAAFLEYSAELAAQQAIFLNPGIGSLLMFMTVFLIGAVITVLSAMILNRKSAPRGAQAGIASGRPSI